MRSALLPLAVLLLGGCASSDARFPSLAIRPAERISGMIQPPPPPKPTAVPPTTASRLDALRQQALAAHRRFESERGRATALTNAAAGAAVASENWSVAQVALAELESSRSDAMVALADLDRVLVAAADAAAPTGGSAELDAVIKVRDDVSELIAAEDAALAALRSRLRE